MTYTGKDNGEAVQALQDFVVSNETNGYSVINPGSSVDTGSYKVTLGSGDLDTSDTLTVGAANDEALFNGSTVSLSAATDVLIKSESTDGNGTQRYRYDLLWIDSNGEVNKTEGSPVVVDDREENNGLTRFERFKGAIPFPDTTPSTIIAGVQINSQDTDITLNQQVRDYRVDADSTFDSVSTNTLTGGVSGSTDITDISGQGLEISSNTLRILSSIYDGTDLVETVNNTSVDTDQITNKDYRETPNVIGNASTTQDIDLSLSNQHKITLTQDTTLTLSNQVNGSSFTLYVEQDGTGGWELTYPTGVLWPSGIERQPTSDANSLTRFTFDSIDGDLIFSSAGRDIKEDTS